MITVLNKQEMIQMQLGERLINAFSQKNTDEVNLESILDFDKDTKDICIKEDDIMRLIQLVNPCQKARHIRLI